MFSLLNCHSRKRTQTRVSAFFCLRGRAVANQVVVAFLIAVVSSAQTPGLDEKKPTAHLRGVSVKAVDWGNRTADTDLSIAIENPGPAFKLKDLSYRLKLNDRQAAEGKYDKAIDVPAGSSATFELPCKVDLSAMPGVVWAVVTGGFDVHYEMETEFTVPLFASLSPKIKTTIAGDLSLVDSISGWTAKIKERIASK
jgi:LEA14-like dessication related protein